MKNITVTKNDRVIQVTLKRVNALNALNSETMEEINQTLGEYDNDPNVGCFIITGSEKVFSAGADIKEMYSKSFLEMHMEDYFSGWEAFAAIRTPKIAAVSGYSFGGGCELAMMCDIIYASSNAQFGQPEIKLGVIPGIGGTQRLTRLVGRVKAMEMILSGKIIDAHEAERIGLVAQVFEPEELQDKVLTLAHQISNFSKEATLAAKELVHLSDQVGINEGIQCERRLFHALFATENQKEGMSAFIEKRAPKFTYQ